MKRTSLRTDGPRFLLWFMATTTQLLKIYGLKKKKKSATDQKVHMRILQCLIFCTFYLMLAKRKNENKNRTTKTPERLELI